MPDNSEILLRAILATIARQTFAPDRLATTIAPKGKGEKQYRAFNMCDGTRTQREIAKALGFDKGNFSRAVARWIEAGIVIRLGEGRDATLLHVCPFTPSDRSKGSGE
jgi:hypothetical protein